MAKPSIQTPIAGVNWRLVYDAKAKEFHDLVKAEGFHALDIDDCSHHRRLPKVIDRPDYMFVVAKVARHDVRVERIAFENIDLFIKPGTLVTVVDNASPILERTQRRLADKTVKPDPLYIAYALLDEIVDDYLLVLDALGETVNAFESNVVKRPSAASLPRIFAARRALIDFRRNAASMREVVHALLRQQTIEKNYELQNYFRDLYGHTVQVIEFIETYRDLLSEALEIYLSSVTNRTNEIVKVLTIYSTIALPPMVITSFYGMNIRMPFQDSPSAFWLVSLVTLALTVGVLVYFKRRSWL